MKWAESEKKEWRDKKQCGPAWENVGMVLLDSNL